MKQQWHTKFHVEIFLRNCKNNILFVKFGGYQGGDHAEWYILGCDAVSAVCHREFSAGLDFCTGDIGTEVRTQVLFRLTSSWFMGISPLLVLYAI